MTAQGVYSDLLANIKTGQLYIRHEQMHLCNESTSSLYFWEQIWGLEEPAKKSW